MKKEFAPTGFVEESGMKLTASGSGVSTEVGKEHNDKWLAASKRLDGWGHSEEIFAGAMDMVGLHGHEQGPERTFDSAKDLDSLHGIEVPGGGRGLVMCKASVTEKGTLPVGGTITPVDLRITDTLRWAHEGKETPMDRRTRSTTLTITPRSGDDALTEVQTRQPFIPLYGRKKDLSMQSMMANHGPKTIGDKPYYSPDEIAREITVELVDGNVSMIYVKTASQRNNGFGPGVVGVNVGKLMDRQRDLNDGTAKGQSLYHDEGIRILDSVTSRIAGMMKLAEPAAQGTKEKRIENAANIKRVAARAAERLDFLPVGKPLPKELDDLPYLDEPARDKLPV